MTNATSERSDSHAFHAMFVARIIGLLLLGLSLPSAAPRIVLWLDYLWNTARHIDPGVAGYAGAFSRTLTATFTTGSTWFGIVTADLIPLSTLILGVFLSLARGRPHRTLLRRFSIW